ncbi:MAG: DUF881 domain-containing protein [Clostridia bacterium]|nr:DUF881 domain-containing protein [Clostridia bacterium]
MANKKEINETTKSFKEKTVEFFKKYSIISYIVIGIALFFLSMLLTAQMKTISNTEELIAGKREAQLADELLTLQHEYDALKDKYVASEKIVEEYKNNSSTNDTLISSMKKEIDTLAALAGTTNLKGEGIVITLTDGTKSSVEINSNNLVHDSDVLTLVNELKAAGAEAISVNDQRIISTSAIRCVGPVIQVNYQKVATPIVIKAIGNAQYLESAMNIKNGIVDLLKGTAGIGITVVRQSDVMIPKFDGVLSFRNATESK